MWCLDEHMIVVRHQDIPIHPHSISLLCGGQALEEVLSDLATEVGGEHTLSSVTTVGDEIDALFRLNATSSSHDIPLLSVGHTVVLPQRVIATTDHLLPTFSSFFGSLL